MCFCALLQVDILWEWQSEVDIALCDAYDCEVRICLRARISSIDFFSSSFSYPSRFCLLARNHWMCALCTTDIFSTYLYLRVIDFYKTSKKLIFLVIVVSIYLVAISLPTAILL